MEERESDIPPACRGDLVIGPPGGSGKCVVKDPRSNRYLQFGPVEVFLLRQLDGRQSRTQIRDAFETRFGKALTDEDLQRYVELVGAKGLLADESSSSRQPARKRRQNPLYWRRSFFDPDRLFDLMEPRLRFFWTQGFVFFSVTCVVLGLVVLAANGPQVADAFSSLLTWQSLLLAWLTLAAVTTCHEFAHGLTCKHYGGKVHEVGFLLIFFTPAFYCNISDAWLLPEKRKRLMVTLAGGYFDLFLWGLAVLVWRVTLPYSPMNQMACVAMAVLAARVVINLNPLIKLDGYYLLSDMVEVPNLHKRGTQRFLAHVRRRLWGAEAPPPEPRAGFVTVYGAAAWLFSVTLLTWVCLALTRLAWERVGVLSASVVLAVGGILMKGFVQGLFAGELRQMIHKRRVRTGLWIAGLGLTFFLLAVIRVKDWAHGEFVLRPRVQVELRATANGFVREVRFDEGDRIEQGSVVALLHQPDLVSQLAQKEAEMNEVRSKLKALRAGSRPEVIAEQRRRVERAEAWCDLARDELRRQEGVFEQEVAALEAQVTQARADHEFSVAKLDRSRGLLESRAISELEYLELEKAVRIKAGRLLEVEATHAARKKQGTAETEAELARREKELAEARSELVLLEAGTRPEEIEAEEARLARLEEEAAALRATRERLRIVAPASGVIATPHLREKIGQYLHEGDLICEIKGTREFDVQVTLREQDVGRIEAGQEVQFKVRAMPLRKFVSRVDRIAPHVVHTDNPQPQGQVTVYCRLLTDDDSLKSHMTGHARIACGQHPLGAIWLNRAVRFLRTEFWFWWE